MTDEVARIAAAVLEAQMELADTEPNGFEHERLADALAKRGLRLPDSRVDIAEPPESAVSGLVSRAAGSEDGDYEREGVDAEAAMSPDRAGGATVGLRLPELRQGTRGDAEGLVPPHANPEGVVQPALAAADIAEGRRLLDIDKLRATFSDALVGPKAHVEWRPDRLPRVRAQDAHKALETAIAEALLAGTPDLDGWGWCDVRTEHMHGDPWTGHKGPHPHKLAPLPPEAAARLREAPDGR